MKAPTNGRIVAPGAEARQPDGSDGEFPLGDWGPFEPWETMNQDGSTEQEEPFQGWNETSSEESNERKEEAATTPFASAGGKSEDSATKEKEKLRIAPAVAGPPIASRRLRGFFGSLGVVSDGSSTYYDESVPEESLPLPGAYREGTDLATVNVVPGDDHITIIMPSGHDVEAPPPPPHITSARLVPNPDEIERASVVTSSPLTPVPEGHEEPKSAPGWWMRNRKRILIGGTVLALVVAVAVLVVLILKLPGGTDGGSEGDGQPTAEPTATPTPSATQEPTVDPTTQPPATPVPTPPVTTQPPTPEPTPPPTSVMTTAPPTPEPTPKETTPTSEPTPAATTPSPTPVPTPEVTTPAPTPEPTAAPTPVPTPVPTPPQTPVMTPVPTPPPTPAVTTPAPTPYPTTRAPTPEPPTPDPNPPPNPSAIRTLLEGEFGPILPGTPQEEAFNWLVNVDPLQLTADTPFHTLKERYALAVLYFATGGVSWNNQYGFLGGASICSWNDGGSQGVFCSGDSVVNLRLLGNNLQGEFPSELTALNSLVVLLLGNNRLRGSIPSFSASPSLNQFHLFENELSGNLQDILAGLNSNSLQYFDLASNNLVGSIPASISRFTNLLEFVVKDCGISGPIPTEMGLLTNLSRYLRLSNNQFTGAIPSELGRLSLLGEVDLGENYLSNTIPSEIGLMRSLHYLNFANNELVGSVPIEIASLPDLENFYLNGNEFQGSLDRYFCERTDPIDEFWADCVAEQICNCCTQCF